MVLEVFKLRIPDLFIMDAVLGMQGNGPASKDLRHIGLVIASDNAVALDAVMARMTGLDPRNLPILTMAAKQGLGSIGKDDISIDGEFRPLQDFMLPPMLESGYAAPGTQQYMDMVIAALPVVDETLCTGCAECVEVCPVKIITMEGKLPHIDIDKCIKCYCCQELCPQKAIQLKV
jgi:ferredoxin